MTTLSGLITSMTKGSLESTVGYAIHRAAIAIKKDISARLKGCGVTVEQFAILVQLWDRDGIIQRDLTRQLLKDKPNVTRILQKLEGKGYIKRQTHPQDRRIHLVFLTATGRDLEKELMPILDDYRASAYKGISRDTQEELKRTLVKIAQNLSTSG